MKYLAIALALLLPVAAYALTLSPTGATFAAKYTEPTTNTAGGPVNLTGTTVYYKVNGGVEKVVQVPASSAAGESVRAPFATLTIDRSGEVAPNPPVAGSFE